MKQDGYTVRLTTHYIAEANTLSDSVAIIDRGRIVATGTPRELVGRTNGEPMVRLWASRPLEREWLETLPAISELNCSGASAQFRSGDVRASVAELMQRLARHGIDVEELR